MTDTELKRQEAICEIAGVNDIGELSDGFHTFNGLYEQRMILFAALVKAYKDKAWKSYRHEDGEYCFGGGWLIVGLNKEIPSGQAYDWQDIRWIKAVLHFSDKDALRVTIDTLTAELRRWEKEAVQ